LVALAIVELLDGPDETDVPLLNQIEEAHAAADVLLRDRHDEAKVRFGQVVSCVVALLDELVGETPQRALLVRVELRELVEMLDEDVAQLRAEHDALAEREAERLVGEAGGLVDELLRTSERHALLDLDAELIQMDHRQRRRDERLFAELNGLREVDLFLSGEQRDLPDLLEVHADRVV